MKRFNMMFLSIAALCLVISSSARAEPWGDGYRYKKYYIDHVVNEDGTENVKSTKSTTALREDVLKDLKQYSISYSTYAEKVEVLEAYVTKTDGRKIPADKNKFQRNINSGIYKNLPPAFSDRSSLTIFFPDVATGDTVTVVYNSTATEPMFPKQFSTMDSYPINIIDDGRISYSIPLSLHARYKNNGMTEAVNKQENGRQFLAWTFKQPKEKKINYTASNVIEIEDYPGIALSTFPSYAAIAEAYGARANPKAMVTDHIRALANDITKGKTTPREQAKALYDWVVENITYTDNIANYTGAFIGLGSVVPRDPDFVIANKMGHCKDIATLLQALLSAKGIESTTALTDFTNLYKLPDIPLVDVVNHVINYIPSLDMYADATSKIPFGFLPKKISGKPVLLVNGYKDGMITPKFPVGSTQIRFDTKEAFTEEGAVDGILTAIITDPGYRHKFQQSVKNPTPQELKERSEVLLKQSGYQGTLNIDLTAWDEKTMTQTIYLRYHFKNYVHADTPGVINIVPPYFWPASASITIGWLLREKGRKDIEKPPHGFVCDDGTMQENYQYTFPKSMSILAIPKDVSISTGTLTYTAKYVLSGQTVNITRTFKDASSGSVCASELLDEYKQLAVKVLPDQKTQIVYK